MTNREQPGLPQLHIVIELEAAPYSFLENIETAADKARMGAWIESNEAACELLNLAGRFYEEGKVDLPPVRVDVADPFVSGV